MHEVPGWAALLMLTSLPLRFLEAHFVVRLIALGAGATQHVDYLVSLSWLVSLALLPALWGRAVFVRAASLALAGGRDRATTGAAPLRVPLPRFVSLAYVSVLGELLLALLGWTIVVLPIVALLTGLGAATGFAGLEEGVEKPGPLAPLGRLLRRAPPFSTSLALTATFAVAIPVAFVNLYALFALALALADGTVPADLTWWQVALSGRSPQFLLLLLAGALTFVEPFWLAALTAAVRGARARESGEDLSARFAEIQADEEAA